jgi:hypothetical protein
LIGPWSADSFVLYETPTGQQLTDWLAGSSATPDDRREVLDQVAHLLGQLRDAGLRPITGRELFRVEPTGRVTVCPTAVRLVRSTGRA